MENQGHWYGYGEVEDAIQRAFTTKKGVMIPATVLRGRIDAMQRQGLVPELPGTGKPVRYTFEDVCDLGLGITLANFGMPPKTILKIVRPKIFENEWKIVEKDDERRLMLIDPVALYESAGLGLSYGIFWISELDDDGTKPFHFMCIDLTDLKHRIREALAVHMSRRMSRGAA